MICEKCGIEFSDKVYKIHKTICNAVITVDKKEEKEDFTTFSKRDLMLKVLSESDRTESKVGRMKKDELIKICESL